MNELCKVSIADHFEYYIFNMVYDYWLMVKTKEPLIVNGRLGQVNFFATSFSNLVIYEAAISSKLIANENNI